MDKKKQQKQLVEQREKMLRDAAKLEQLFAEFDGESINVEYASRYEVPPPETKDQSKYNPNKMVDIETFITHPYFLNLRHILGKF